MGMKTVISKVDSVLGTEITEAQEPRPKLPVADMPSVGRWGGLLTAVCAVVIAVPYLQADFWFDEMLTLNHYAVQDHLAGVFTSYRIANNHILFSAILWGWLRLFSGGNEAFLRLPCLFFFLATLYVAYVHSRRLFKHAAAALFVTLLMAFSPICLSFFMQLRGYSLTILLSMVATIGAIYLATDHFGRGTVMFCVGTLLMPVVVPSNLVTNAALFLFLSVIFLRRRCWSKRLLYLVLPAISAGAGMFVYVPIWKKFRYVLENTAGWSSGWLVLGHWLLALFLSLGLFVLACIGLRRKGVPVVDEESEETHALHRALPWLGVCALLCLALVSLLRAPFPRALLGLYPPLLFAAMMFYRRELVQINKYFYLMIFFILTNFFVVNRCADHFRDQALAHGAYPQNLLQQYYSRKRDISTTLTFVKQRGGLPPNGRILADFHLFLTAKHYWNLLEGNPRMVECLNQNDGRFQLNGNPEHYAYFPCIVLAYDREQAIESFRRAYGLEIDLYPLPSPTALQIFRLIGPIANRPGPSSPEAPLLPEADQTI